jgi:phage portal protein BeeE
MSLKSYEKKPEGRIEVKNPFFENVNNYQTEFDFRKYMAVTAVFNGNSYAYIDRKTNEGLKDAIHRLVSTFDEESAKEVEKEMELVA